jgi:hypothetical protein
MKSKNDIKKGLIIAGFLISSIFPVLIFSHSYYINYLNAICYFGEFWNSFFWGIIFPVFVVFLFWNSSKKLSFLLNQNSHLKASFKFSFKVSSKFAIALITIYLIGEFAMRVSFAFLLYYYSIIIFSLRMILFLSFLLMILTFISSLIIIKASQNTQNLNQTK